MRICKYEDKETYNTCQFGVSGKKTSRRPRPGGVQLALRHMALVQSGLAGLSPSEPLSRVSFVCGFRHLSDHVPCDLAHLSPRTLSIYCAVRVAQTGT